MNMQEDKSIIEVSHVSKYFGDKTALDDVTLNVKKGEFVTILGPSGCGKTTLLRLIAGFQTASEGEIRISGMEITQTPPHKRPVNTVFQKYALFPHLNVYDNIAFGLKLKKTPKQTIEKKVKAALKMVGMTDYEYRDVDSLSGGQQQRVAIARAIVNEPEVLLLDEPLAALDLKMRKDMQMELKEMHKSLGITFVYVTHDQEEALTLSDTIVVMSEGTAGYPTIKYTINSTIATQTDFLVAKTVGMTKTPEGKVSLGFNHALTQIEFKLKGDDNDIIYTVTGLTLKGIAKSGSYSYETGKWLADSATDDYTMGVLSTPVNGTSPVELTANTQLMILMPQTLSGASVEVTYSAKKVVDGKEVILVNEGTTKTAELTGTWNVGEKNVYTLVLKAGDQIQVSGNIEKQWTPKVPDVDVPVENDAPAA